MPFSVKEIYDDVLKRFDGNKRLAHILGVADVAKEIGHLYGLDEDKCYIAGLLHDYAKYDDQETMKKMINDEEIYAKFSSAPQIYHAYASANYAINKFGITDIDIIEAIRYHVYGCLGMNNYIKAIVLADFIDPTREYEECIRVRNLFNETHNLNLAVYETLKAIINNVLSYGHTLVGNQLEILKEIKEELDKDGIITND